MRFPGLCLYIHISKSQSFKGQGHDTADLPDFEMTSVFVGCDVQFRTLPGSSNGLNTL